ncbi:MAG: hypothetical protein JXR76_18625 [Deltaproteobacteria bacterium]|nr:hypothetical protein [Deltaproteobacteria bacterium]
MVFAHPSDAQDDAAEKPTILMLFMASSEISSIESALRNELELNIDTHRLKIEPDFIFQTETITEKIGEIRKLESATDCDAVVWVEKSGEHAVTLQMVVLAPGQFTIQSVEANVARDGIGELMIAARELLNDIQIPVHSPKVESQKPQQNTPNDTTPPGQPVPSAQRAHTAKAFFSIDGGAAGDFKRGDSSPLFLNGSLSLGAQYSSRIRLALLLSASGASPWGSSDSIRKFVGVGPGVQLGVTWTTGMLALTPFVTLTIPYQAIRISLENEFETKDKWWNGCVSGGVSMQFPLSRHFHIYLHPALNVYLEQKVFKRMSDGSAVFTTPRFMGNVAVGFRYFL